MARIKVKTQLDGVKVKLEKMTAKGQYALANQVMADSNRYVPKLSGDLRIQSQITGDQKQVVWNSPYARKQYYNVGAKFTTPGTGPKWDQKALSIHKKTWERIIKAAMK